MSDPTREMLEDARLQLDMLREALGVSVEPHQSLFERTMERARRMEESDREYSELADYLQSENPAASEAIRALLADLEDAEKHCSISDAFAKQLTSDLVATRKQLAEAQADNAAMHSAAHRLALEAECFYLDCKDMALVSKWDDPLQTAISDVQAIRWSGDTSALSAAIAEAVEPYKRDAERWRNLNPYYTAAVFDPEREDGLDLGEGIALIFIIPKGSRVSGNADATIDALAAKEAP